MPIQLTELDIRVLEVIEEKKKSHWGEIQHELRFEFPNANWKNCFSLITQKKLVQDVTEPGYSEFIELSDAGKSILQEYKPKHQPAVNRLIHLNNPTTQNITFANKEKSKIKSFIEIVSWVVGIGAALVAIYEFILKKFLQ